MKIVSATEMASIEALAIKEGQSAENFMEKAALGIADQIEKYALENALDKHLYLLIGKGNNGGDAYLAGSILLKRGFTAIAIESFLPEDISPLSQKMRKTFLANKGKTIHFSDFSFSKKGIIVDGLLGTGFKGEVKEPFLTLINKANESSMPIISIDIPSGLNGDTGMATIAIKASVTIFLGLAKTGFFLGSGFNYVKKLASVDFGLPDHYTQQMKSEFDLAQDNLITSYLPKIEVKRHKYEAGYVLGIAGSKGMEGAAKLSSLATLVAGAGIMRLYYPKEMENEMACFPPEILKTSYTDNLDHLKQELIRAKAIYIGPGLGREEKVFSFLTTLLPLIDVPCVIDADGLFFLSKYKEQSLPKHVVLTPHKKEMLRLLDLEQIEDEISFYQRCQTYCEKKKATIVLKGAPSMVFHPDKKPLIIARGDPALATAGTGDVLTGIIAALLAQGLDPYKAACLGVFLHAVAGEMAAKNLGPYSVIASDVIEYLPEVFLQVMS